jgi:hypothetical protein
MDYTGMVRKFKVDRPLNAEERKLQLKQREHTGFTPFFFRSTIRTNSTFIELVDKYYAGRGILTFVLAGGIPLCIFMIILDIYAFVFLGLLGNAYDRNIVIFGGPFLFVLCVALLVFSVWGVKKDAFIYTHYPIRLNRKTRMVHVFRLSGGVLTAPWDSLFFTMGRADRLFGIQKWDLRVHVLDTDGVTVRETFTVSVTGLFRDDVGCHWEYLVRYMEEGPQAVIPLTPAYLPIAEHRETLRFGLMILLAQFENLAIFKVLMSPVMFIYSLSRWLAMRTCKIPVWPSEVEAACRIDPDDPCRRDARDNPRKLWAAISKAQSR